MIQLPRDTAKPGAKKRGKSYSGSGSLRRLTHTNVSLKDYKPIRVNSLKGFSKRGPHLKKIFKLFSNM